jgi:hypothetical protein
MNTFGKDSDRYTYPTPVPMVRRPIIDKTNYNFFIDNTVTGYMKAFIIKYIIPIILIVLGAIFVSYSITKVTPVPGVAYFFILGTYFFLIKPALNSA